MSALMDRLRLNWAERRLVRAAEHDTVADLRTHGDGERGVIRSWLLRELCTGARQWTVKDRIRVRGGRVEGRLDLSGARLSHPLHFAGIERVVSIARSDNDFPTPSVGDGLMLIPQVSNVIAFAVTP